MKKNAIYALMSAIALTGAVGFSSCSSTEDGVAEVNPGYNSSTGEVPVEFIFNVASGSNHSSTRQSADATQAYALTDMTSARFRGIEDAHVMCFKQLTNGKHIIIATTADKDYDMARVATAGSLDKDKSTRVLEMSLPIKTNSIVFYGRAITNTSETRYKDIYGHLADADGYTVDPNLANVSFHLCKRLTDDDKAKFQQIQSLLASVLTCIMETDRGTAGASAGDIPTGAEGTTENPGNPYVFDIDGALNPNMKWSAYASTVNGKSPITGYTDKEQWPLEQKLANVYKEMTTIRTAELRNASGPALRATIEDLWTIINGIRYARPTALPEAVAKYMAQQIHIELSKYFSGTVPVDGGPVTGVNIKSVPELVTSLASDSYWPASAGDKPTSFGEINGTTPFASTALQVFPETFDLPQGATHILFDTTKKQFSYAVNYNSSAAGGATFTVDDYYFPPELLYFGNSPIKVSDASYEAKDYPKTTANWDNASYEFWTTAKEGHSWVSGGEVKTSTRSVAMTNDINYGTALLQTTVQYGTTSLEDNNKIIQKRDYNVDEPNNTITPSGTSFILKGILVGGQYPRVGWNFLPALKDGERQGYVFDKMITNNGVIPASDKSEPNYTLVFDNYNPAGQDKVYVALELQNNTGQGFFGKDNLIPHGSNFYLIGELDPAKDGLAAPTWSSYHPLPPYNEDGTSNKIARVFMQDHKTIVNFKIGQYSLQYAYLNIPDLRSSSVTLGLSVDMEWSAGLNFGDVIIGGNAQTPDPVNP